MSQWRGIKPSCSQPRVTDENAYAESMFRAARYCPERPFKGFGDLIAARRGMRSISTAFWSRSRHNWQPIKAQT
jgi:hypothetical protein